ncbi:SIS domain-containing protein [Bacillus sp. V3-13]|uniref:SIS domain-containing protein n=1 Tax=Bacillus sp. V3-13 TaxID=2053728 RepID=UPI000C76A0C2|nr:SIS domain-containing protein [Bacillus sp. V3-13]PLR75224.1 SIS domain-containing protein [Bacillus sp. V3-13]
MNFLKNKEIDKTDSRFTAKEIDQQPKLWLETLQIIHKQKEEIHNFLNEKVYTENARIIFTGAGSSAYIGDTLAPFIRRNIHNQVESIPTTDLVANPLNYFKKETTTVLISFARSGNSPESIGAYDLARQLIPKLYHIVITCNRDGNLAKKAKADENSLVIYMPEDSNDKGFAMTSSFSCMYMSALLLFNIEHLDEIKKKIDGLVENARRILDTQYKEIQKIIDLNKKKVVYLGSSTLMGLAKEACLKHLELTAGSVTTLWESVLGFRHGPKSIVDNETVIIIYISNDPYTRKYELDLLRELQNDGGDKHVVAVVSSELKEAEELCNQVITVPGEHNYYLDDSLIVLNYLIYGQIFALLNSIKHGISPDNPSPSGVVNRVVQGVQLYSFNN